MNPAQKERESFWTGVWSIDKPVGPTSHDVVATIRSRSRIKRVGHTGTLDPLASGVLVICVGKATRIIEYLADDKEYEAELQLGITTDTFDAAGKVTGEKPVPEITLGQLQEVCQAFTGKIQQVPPMVSAKRHQGKRLYELAREGKEVERKPVEVTIGKFEILEFKSPLLKIRIVCTAGTYIRALANDLGQALGCGAHLKTLRRLRVGSFDIARTQTLPEWEKAWAEGKGRETLIPLEKAVPHLPVIPVTAGNARVALTGRPLIMTDEECPGLAGADPFDPPYVSLILPDGSLFAIAQPKRKIRGWIIKADKIFKTDV